MNDFVRSSAPKLLTILAGLLAFSTIVSADSHSNRLHCKGGQHTVLILEPTTSGTQIQVGYKRSDQPASEGLEPGACSWMDRGMAEGDPKYVQFFARGFFVKVILSEHFSSYQPVRIGEATEASELLGRELTYLLDATRGGGDFIVHVEPDGKDMWEITRIGP